VENGIIEVDELNEGELPVNKIVHGHVFEALQKFPDESVDYVITSPPYWGKRDYGEETCTIWGGDPDCEHEWVETPPPRRRSVNDIKDPESKQATVRGCAYDAKTGLWCEKCGAWSGQLGLEPTPEMFVDHLIEIFREIKRVLKPHGNVFVVIDDTWSGSQGWKGGGGLSYKEGEWEREWVKDVTVPEPPSAKFKGAPRKSLCLVPELFAIRMVYDLNFILRQKIIWSKKVLVYKERTTIGNAMPESVKDRLAHTWEYVYHFVKKPKYYYNLDSVRVPVKTINDKPKNAKTNNTKYEGTSEFTFADNLAKIRKRMRELGLPEGHPLGSNPGDVLQINTEPFPEAHFAVFPTRLVEFLIKVGCPKEGIVLDPFLGSGTTALVALQMGRRFVGIELNREYCEMALKRIGPYLKQQRLVDFNA